MFRNGEAESGFHPKWAQPRTDKRIEPGPLMSAVTTRLYDPQQSSRTHVEEALCHQRVEQMTGLTKIRWILGRGVAGVTCHPIGGIEESCRTRGRGVFGAESSYHRCGWNGGQMLVRTGDQKRIGERQTTAVGCWLKADVHILAAAQAVREMNEAGFVHETGHVVSSCTQLLRDGRMGHNDARDGGGVIRADENRCGTSDPSLSSNRDPEKTDAEWRMSVLASVEQANLWARQWAIRKEEVRVVRRAGH